MKTESIAQIAHEVNRGYSVAMGDDSYPSWVESTPDQQLIVTTAVTFYIENPEAEVASFHEAWLEKMTEEGWVFGEELSEEGKTHPLIVPFDALPEDQKAKYFMFRAVVQAVSSLPPEEEVSVQRVVNSVVVKPTISGEGKLPITYIGKRDEYTDGAFGTHIHFRRGETKLVPEKVAMLMLRHPDVYVLGEAEGAVSAEVGDANPKTGDTETELQDTRDSINAMADVDAVKAYVEQHYGTKMHHNIGLEKAKAHAIGLVDQFGLK
jgi:hypothetical protein